MGNQEGGKIGQKAMRQTELQERSKKLSTQWVIWLPEKQREGEACCHLESSSPVGLLIEDTYLLLNHFPTGDHWTFLEGL